jgi:hypothetical protein
MPEEGSPPVSPKRGNHRKGIKSQFLVQNCSYWSGNRKIPGYGHLSSRFRSGQGDSVRSGRLLPGLSETPRLTLTIVGPDIDLDVNEHLVILGGNVRS